MGPREIFRRILTSDRKAASFETIGMSRSGLEVQAARFGSGSQRVSLIGGMHADEPIGPLFLRYFCGFLASLPQEHVLLRAFSWWIVPHGNPDGEERNAEWFKANHHMAHLGEYLVHRSREAPGDDLEFGFPRDSSDHGARPEARALLQWWESDATPIVLHASLHGMAFAAGPWFLLAPEPSQDLSQLKARCREASARLGYVLHDVERKGEKGFHRIDMGFCTHPTASAMRQYFEAENDFHTATLFRPSSMEIIRSRYPQALTLVSEIPLFVLPGVGLELGPPDPVAEQWRDQIAEWETELREGVAPDDIETRALAAGVTPVPYDHQLELLWNFLFGALEVVAPEDVSAIVS